MQNIFRKLKSIIERHPKLKRLALRTLDRSPRLKYFVIKKLIVTPSFNNDPKFIINSIKVPSAPKKFSKNSKKTPLEHYMQVNNTD